MYLNLDKIKKIHFVGIKGVAMTALAIIAKEMGKIVVGSDLEGKFPTENILGQKKIKVEIGFSAKHIKSDIDLVIYTGAHEGIKNLEVQIALKLGINCLSHGKALGLFMENKRCISVAGSHGKTTTSAMIAHILMKLNFDPSFAIGCGNILSLNTPGHYGQGEFFIAEADEYITDPQSDFTPRFMWQKPELLVITNIDYDHPDAYSSLDEVKTAFINFSEKIQNSGKIICNIDDPATRDILSKLNRKFLTFGTTNKANYLIKNIQYQNSKTTFDLSKNNSNIGKFTIPLFGIHNVYNAASAIVTCLNLGIAQEMIVKSINSFIGTKRRFEFIADKNGKLFYDDYAHHPAEIAATIASCKQHFPDKRLIVIFQPHTFSRTKVLLKKFCHSFSQADILLITQIYASAREKKDTEISGKIFYEHIVKNKPNTYFVSGKKQALDFIKHKTQKNDLIITMGAGDIYAWIDFIKVYL